MQTPLAGRAQKAHRQLKPAARRINGRLREDLNRIALRGHNAGQRVLPRHHHAIGLPVFIAQDEIPMPGRRAREVRHFADQPQRRETILNNAARRQHKLAHRHRLRRRRIPAPAVARADTPARGGFSFGRRE